MPFFRCHYTRARAFLLLLDICIGERTSWSCTPHLNYKWQFAYIAWKFTQNKQFIRQLLSIDRIVPYVGSFNKSTHIFLFIHFSCAIFLDLIRGAEETFYFSHRFQFPCVFDRNARTNTFTDSNSDIIRRSHRKCARVEHVTAANIEMNWENCQKLSLE